MPVVVVEPCHGLEEARVERRGDSLAVHGLRTAKQVRDAQQVHRLSEQGRRVVRPFHRCDARLTASAEADHPVPVAEAEGASDPADSCSLHCYSSNATRLFLRLFFGTQGSRRKMLPNSVQRVLILVRSRSKRQRQRPDPAVGARLRLHTGVKTYDRSRIGCLDRTFVDFGTKVLCRHCTPAPPLFWHPLTVPHPDSILRCTMRKLCRLNVYLFRYLMKRANRDVDTRSCDIPRFLSRRPWTSFVPAPIKNHLCILRHSGTWQRQKCCASVRCHLTQCCQPR